MVYRILVVFAILAVVVASAGTVPAPGGSYKITFTQPSTVKGVELKAGDYRLTIVADKITITSGKKTMVEAAAKVETEEKKFDATAIRYVTEGGKVKVSEIRVGGTKTKVLFE
jgi:hypothetical protein